MKTQTTTKNDGNRRGGIEMRGGERGRRGRRGRRRGRRNTMDGWVELWPDGIFWDGKAGRAGVPNERIEAGGFLARSLAHCGMFHGRSIAVLLPNRRR